MCKACLTCLLGSFSPVANNGSLGASAYRRARMCFGKSGVSIRQAYFYAKLHPKDFSGFVLGTLGRGGQFSWACHAKH